jgi:integrase
MWWCKYYVNGGAVRESTKCEREQDARRFLKLREGAVAAGAPIPPRVDRILYDELAEDLRTFYRTTGRWKNLDDVEDRLVRLDAHFKGYRAASITPDLIAKYVAKRQAEPTHLIARRCDDGTVVHRLTSNRTINFELALLRRMFRLAVRRRKVLSVPAIEMLGEAPARAGFFEEEQYRAVAKQLPEDLQTAVAIAHTFGWRIRSEVLTLERRHLDLRAGTLRLSPA